MNKNKIIKYLGFTFLITWTFFLIRAILCNMNIISAYSPIGLILYGIGIFGPTVGAISCFDNKSPKRIMKTLFNHKKNSLIYLIILAILYFLTFYISTFSFSDKYPIYMAPLLFLGMLVVGGCNEEIGWYGVLYHELSKKYNAPLTTGISLIIWFIWHLPMFITHTDMHYGMPLMSFFLFLLSIALMKTALIRKTDSIFYCGVIHALANVYETIILYEQNTSMVTATIILWIISIVLWYYPKDDEKNDNNEDKVLEKEKEEDVITPIINPELQASTIEIDTKHEVEELI